MLYSFQIWQITNANANDNANAHADNATSNNKSLMNTICECSC
jgi:hypothetical protein